MPSSVLSVALAGCLVGSTAPGAGPRDGAPWQAALARSGELRLSADWDAARALVERALGELESGEDRNARLRLLVERSAIEREINAYRERNGWSAALEPLHAAEILLDGASREHHAVFAEEKAWLEYNRAFDGGATIADARRSFEGARLLYEETDDRAGLAAAWFGIGLTHQQEGRLEEARVSFALALELAERAGAIIVQGFLHRHLGFVEADLSGHPAAALASYERSLALRERAGHRWGAVFAMITLGRALIENGDVHRARTLLHGAVDAGIELRLARGVAEAQEALADLERSSKADRAACGHLDEAARWWATFGQTDRPSVRMRREAWGCRTPGRR